MNQANKKDLSIVIVTFNSSKIIESCLSKINFDRYDVVIVDNASSDNTINLVTSKFPKTKIIKLSQNVGYGNGNNAALEQVDTDFALILNPDAVILEKDIEIVLDSMKKDEKIALAGPLTLRRYYDRDESAQEAMQKIEKNSLINKENNGNFLVKFIVGAAVFMRMSILKKIGFYDKNIFLYYEDDELCRRVIKNNYKNIIVIEAIAFHLEAQSSQKSFKGSCKKAWHFEAWSKLYWKKIVKGNLMAKKSAIRLIIKYFFKTILSLLKFDAEDAAYNFSAFLGAFSFLIGLDAFRKNGSPRG